MRISDWSSDVCSSDLPPYRDARIVAQQVDRAVVAVYPIGDRRHLIWPGDVELDGRPVQFLGHRLSRLQFDVGNDDMHTGTRKGPRHAAPDATRSEEHTSELQSLMRISYAVFCLKKKIQKQINNKDNANTQMKSY